MTSYTVFCGTEYERPIVTHEVAELLGRMTEGARYGRQDAVYTMGVDQVLSQVERLAELIEESPKVVEWCDYEGTEESVGAVTVVEFGRSMPVSVRWTCPVCGTWHENSRYYDDIEAQI